MGCDALYDARLAISGKDVALFDLATWKNGLAFKKIDFSDSGIPVIKIAELNNGIGSSTSFTRGVYSSDVKLQRGDFLFSWSGNPETSIDIFRFELEEGWLNQHIFKTTPNSSLVTGDYFFYLMKWLKPVFKSVASNKQTTGLGHITISDLKKIKVTVPAKDFQGKVAAILTAIDNKISLNAKLNGYLEELALALYTEYLEWNDGELPIGWVCRPLSDFFPVKTGKKDANIATENGLYPFFTCGKQNLFTDNYSFDGSAILVAGNGDFSVKWYEGKFEAYQRTYVLMPNDPVLLGYLYCAVKRNLSNITSKSRGSVIKFITKGNIADCEIAVPPIPEMNEIIKHLNQILRVIDANKRDTALLKELRDVLLPKLMSGEIDVSKIDLMQLNSHLA